MRTHTHTPLVCLSLSLTPSSLLLPSAMDTRPLLLSCLFLASSSTFALAWNLTPPRGYSIHLKTKALDGIHTYRCTDGDWIPHSAFATLVDSSDPGFEVGNYTFVYLPRQPRYVGTWILRNSNGDAAESGSPVSLVSGKQIVSFSAHPGHLAQFLAEASLHESYGAASFVSYIARLNTNGGVVPPDDYCEDNTVTKIPFQAEFYLWRQDVVPPSVPQQLQLGSYQRAVESFFGKGFVKYVFNGKEWEKKKVLAKIYDLPGGVQVGSYFVKCEEYSPERRYHWNISNPNGFEIVAKDACNPISVEPSSLPWTLMVVTSSTGNTSLLGPFSYVHMVSTSGGLSPRISTASVGRVWRSSFSAIFWFYRNDV